MISFCGSHIKTNVLLGVSLTLGAGRQGSHEEFHFAHKVAPFHFVPLNLSEGPPKIVPFIVLQHVTLGEIFALASRELHHDLAAAFWTVAY